MSWLNQTELFGFTLANWLYFVVLCLGFVAVLLGGVAYTTLFERRVISLMQVRRGPNRAGPLGVLQPIADGVKLFFKEDTVPDTADKVLHKLAPAISLFAALAAFAVVPVGDAYTIPGFGTVQLWIADLNVGVLYLLGVASIGVYGVVLGGWSSGNKYSLLGALRGAAQLVSYEIVLGLSLVGVVMITGEMSLRGIVQWQAEHQLPLVLLQPVGFALFVIGMFAETNRAPFDLVEADTELVAGFHTEYSGFRFGMYMMSEYLAMITVSAVATTLFLGGWGGPFGFLSGPWWVVLGIVCFLFLFVWVRATIPRLRYDQLMRFSWSWLIPLGLLNLAVTAVLVVLLDS
ncbi:MAG: NADH-quinone oxidoreductase subunit H [Deltaproteobacteria bacterium RBG_16_71_12]|nr:MAG: NADH-quinone oxidoreductase subunit H [Deltaproteobacteria bacterium RBG_16_71_12]